MASSYFTLPSFARAKKNTEELEKTNPQNPVLKAEDESFLNEEIAKDRSTSQHSEKQESAIQIADDGEVKEVSREEVGGEAVVPATQPETSDDSGGIDGGDSNDQIPAQADGPSDGAESASYDDKLKEKAEEAKKTRKAKKDTMDLPSQEEAEAATQHGFDTEAEPQQDKSQGEKRTWKSYIPTVRPSSKKGTADDTPQQPASSESTEDPAKTEATSTEQSQEGATDQPQQDKRTWTQYASAYVPSSWTTKKKEDPDAKMQPVYKEDGTIDEEATKEQQEREVSVLLDNLNLSSINNRVFTMNQETQKLYGRFAQCLKDIINGAPTAYHDMDELMKEAGPKLEEQYKQLPPFVQTLVKSLPAKMGGVVGPELLAIASEKPGDDMKKRMAAASKTDAGAADGGINVAAASTGDEGTTVEVEGKDGEKKTKRRIPGMKSLVGNNSAVAGMLRSVVNFLTVRFPFLASATNIVMSLAVFILMFVFWYCHKRGREVRLANEAADSGEGKVLVEGAEGNAEDEDVEISDSDEDAEEKDAEAGEGDEMMKEIDEKANALSQPSPAEVPIPEQVEETAAVTEEKKEDETKA